MSVLINIAIVAGTFATMEFVAWFTHKYVMHGILWYLHKDHHVAEKGFFERNDSFFLLFAVPSLILCILGSGGGFDYRFWIGIGILLYGIAYFLVHDVFIHQRFKVLKRTDSVYFRALRKAHKVHHKHLVAENGECFGMLLVPFKYFKEAARSARSQ